MDGGGWFWVESIPYFDGDLFDDDAVLELDAGALAILDRVTTPMIGRSPRLPVNWWRRVTDGCIRKARARRK